MYASDLRTLSPHNVIIKYADDTTLLVGQHSSVDIIQEYDNICAWSARNKGPKRLGLGLIIVRFKTSVTFGLQLVSQSTIFTCYSLSRDNRLLFLGRKFLPRNNQDFIFCQIISTKHLSTYFYSHVFNEKPPVNGKSHCCNNTFTDIRFTSPLAKNV